MNGKYLGVVIGAVVAIMLVGSVLMPIINDETEEEEQTVVASGAVGPNIAYNAQSDVYAQNPLKFWFRIVIDTDSELGNVLKFSRQASGTEFYYIYPIGDNFDNKTVILYSDDIITVYVVNGVITSTIEELYTGYTLPIISGDTDLDGWANKNLFRVTSLIGNTLKYDRYEPTTQSGDVVYNATSQSDEGRIAYAYQPNESGQYSTIEGNDPPSMDIPSVSVSGAYIGPKMTVITTSNPAAPIYLAIPIVILVALLTAVAFVAFRRDY